MDLVYAIDSLHSGGAQRQVVELAVHLRARAGLRPRVLIYRESGFYAERLIAHGIPVYVVPKRFRFDPLLPGRIRAWLCSNPPDLLHAFLSLPAMWSYAALRGMPPAQRPAFLIAERSSLRAPTLRDNLLKRLLYPRCDALTVNAQSVAAEIERELRVPAGRLHYIPNGIDLTEWDRLAAGDPPTAMDPDRFQLALVGGLRSEKNHPLVLAALRRLGDERIRTWRVWFIGSDADEPRFARRLRREIARSGLASVVRILPPTPRIGALMRRLDGLLLPSRYEGFPNVALEAMASRVPVVASAVGDVPNMIDDGESGFVLERLGAEPLERALLRLHDLGRAGRAAMGERARAAVEARFSMESVAARYVELYRSLVSGR